MRNITPPRMVSFEDALRNLAARLTGQPTTELPRTQEAIVQYMAENIPTLDEMAEVITREVMARLAADEQPQSGENGTEGSGGSPDTQDGENGTGDTQDNQDGSDSKDNAAADQATPAAANADAEKPKRTTRKPKTTN